MREEYDICHLSGDVITLISHWSDPKFKCMYNCQVTCKALYSKLRQLANLAGSMCVCFAGLTAMSGVEVWDKLLSSD